MVSPHLPKDTRTPHPWNQESLDPALAYAVPGKQAEWWHGGSKPVIFTAGTFYPSYLPCLTQEGKDIKGCSKLPSQTFSSEYALRHWRRENTNFTPAASGEISTTPPEPSVRSFPCCKGTSQFQGTQRPHDWSIAFIRSDSWFIFPGRKLLAPAATAATSAMEICIEVY